MIYQIIACVVVVTYISRAGIFERSVMIADDCVRAGIGKHRVRPDDVRKPIVEWQKRTVKH